MNSSALVSSEWRERDHMLCFSFDEAHKCKYISDFISKCIMHIANLNVKLESGTIFGFIFFFFEKWFHVKENNAF